MYVSKLPFLTQLSKILRDFNGTLLKKKKKKGLYTRNTFDLDIWQAGAHKIRGDMLLGWLLGKLESSYLSLELNLERIY